MDDDYSDAQELKELRSIVDNLKRELQEKEEELVWVKELIRVAHSEGYDDAMHHVEYKKSFQEFRNEHNL